jgi:hypothetical protein
MNGAGRRNAGTVRRKRESAGAASASSARTAKSDAEEAPPEAALALPEAPDWDGEGVWLGASVRRCTTSSAPGMPDPGRAAGESPIGSPGG